MTPFEVPTLSAPQKRELARMLEAWIYAIALIVAAVICQLTGQWWPMWLLLGLVAVLAGLRLR